MVALSSVARHLQLTPGVMQTMRTVVRKWMGVSIACAILALSCTSAPRAQLCLGPDEAVPNEPFELTVELSSTEVSAGDNLKVTYHLFNRTDRPMGACPDGLDEFHLINIATGANRGLVHTSTAISPDTIVRLPAKGTLTWVRSIEVPDVGTGEAKFMGKFESGCPLWTGQVWSKPVMVHVK
jgi:hypothetical protein